MRQSLLLALGLTALLLPAPVQAQESLEAARKAMSSLRYKVVIQEAPKALAQPGNSHDVLVELYSMLGIANGALGKSQAAADAFTKLLAIEPKYQLPSGLSPKITLPFKEAGGFWLDRPDGLSVKPSPPAQVRAKKAIAVPVAIDDALSMGKTVRLSYRSGEADWTVLTANAAAKVSFEIPASAVPASPDPYDLEYTVTVLDENGGELRLAGDPTAPLKISVLPVAATRPVDDRPDLVPSTQPPGGTTPVEPEARPSIFTKWWFWTAVGVVAIGGAGATYWALSGGGDDGIGLTVTSEVAP
jgi:hypothetical protein